MAQVDVRLLGGFEARLSTGHKVAPKMQKTQALLAYLALTPGKARSRDHLVGLLWSDRADEQGRSSLRQALAAMRRELHLNGSDVLKTEGENISLEPGTIEVDVLEFEKEASDGSNRSLGRADSLYRGPLLDGIKVRDPAFDDWLSQERSRLEGLAIEVLERLLAGLLREGDHEAAIATAQRLLARDPLRESAYRTLMRLYMAQDQRGLAAREFERCRETLANELQVKPAPATTRLYQEIVAPAGSTMVQEIAGENRPAPLPMPSRPSVVVLPFVNLSGDTDQSYLSDGLTEDVITSMSRFQSLFVIGAESALALSERTASHAQIANDLGVEYVVEGSVRKAGDSLRVTVQLIDPFTGHRLWTERYERRFSDIFAIQDEIVANIAGALSINVEHAWAELTRNRPSDALGAYDCCLRARQSLWKWTAEGVSGARTLFEKATELDPNCALAWAGLARIYNKDAFFKPGIASENSLLRARECAEKAILIDPKSGPAYAQLSWVHLCLGDHGLAREFLAQATRWDPNESEVLSMRVYVLGYLGELDAALKTAEFGLRVNPFNRDFYLDAKLVALLFKGRYRDAAKVIAQIQTAIPDCLAWQAAVYAYLGECAAAKAMVKKFVREFGAIWEGDPSAGPAEFAHWVAYVANPIAQEDHRQRLVEGMRLAGLPI
jgi:TolB-like protein/Tfp pilus assembly protein PilF